MAGRGTQPTHYTRFQWDPTRSSQGLHILNLTVVSLGYFLPCLLSSWVTSASLSVPPFYSQQVGFIQAPPVPLQINLYLSSLLPGSSSICSLSGSLVHLVTLSHSDLVWGGHHHKALKWRGWPQLYSTGFSASTLTLFWNFSLQWMVFASFSWIYSARLIMEALAAEYLAAEMKEYSIKSGLKMQDSVPIQHGWIMKK